MTGLSPVACVALVLVAGKSALAQSLASFETASASSICLSGAFPPESAIMAGSGYWCSSGNHAPGQHVTWTGSVGTPQMATGLSINWAYGPGEFRVLTSADGGNFQEAAGWNTVTRTEASYEQIVMFEKPQSTGAVAIVMRSPQPWGYFGITDVSLMVQPGTSMLVAESPTGIEDLCLVAESSALTTQACLDVIAGGAGVEIFGMSDASQLISTISGQCVTLVNGGIGLQDCEEAAEAGDGRSTFAVTADGQLQPGGMGSYCLAVSSTSVSTVACSSGSGLFRLIAVPSFDPAPFAQAADTAALLQAAALRQSAMLERLRQRMSELSACTALVHRNSSTPAHNSWTGNLNAKRAASFGSVLELGSKIDAALQFDLASVKALILETKGVLESVAAGGKLV